MMPSVSFARDGHTCGRNVIAVLSITGGAGKTSLVANLGRALAQQGQRVFLIDTAPHGLLPFHFGAEETCPGQVRTIEGKGIAGLRLMSLSVPGNYVLSDDAGWMRDVLMRETSAIEYVLIDISTASLWLTRQILRLCNFVLLPLMPDMSTLLSISCIQDYLNEFFVSENEQPPYFAVLNQFDSGIAFHRRMRTELQARLGAHFVPMTLSRDVRISEMFSGDSNWMDQYPASPLAQDYQRLSLWLQKQMRSLSREVADL